MGSALVCGPLVWSAPRPLHGFDSVSRADTEPPASFGPLLEETYGVSGALTVALAAATYGLVSGSMMGGPIARRRVEKLGLKSTAAQEGNASDDKGGIIDGQKFTNAAVFLAIAIGAGTLIMTGFSKLNITMPAYIGAMLFAASFKKYLGCKGS